MVCTSCKEYNCITRPNHWHCYIWVWFYGKAAGHSGTRGSSQSPCATVTPHKPTLQVCSASSTGQVCSASTTRLSSCLTGTTHAGMRPTHNGTAQSTVPLNVLSHTHTHHRCLYAHPLKAHCQKARWVCTLCGSTRFPAASLPASSMHGGKEKTQFATQHPPHLACKGPAAGFAVWFAAEPSSTAGLRELDPAFIAAISVRLSMPTQYGSMRRLNPAVPPTKTAPQRHT
jgi:hypothetical protein